jgi:hypothetical protein
MLSLLASLTLQVAAVGPSTLALRDSVRPDRELRVAGQRYAPIVRSCYEREGLKRDPNLTGTLDVSVVIQPRGAVQHVRIDTTGVSGIGMRDVADCVAQAASGWRFSSGVYALEEPTFTYKLVPPADTARAEKPPG